MLGALIVLGGLGYGAWYGYEKIYKGLPGVAKAPPVKAPSGVIGVTPIVAAVVTPAVHPAGVQIPQPPFDLSRASVHLAWQSDPAYIKQYQGALTYLSSAMREPSWDPQGVDGILGPHTGSAVRSFQQMHSLAVDGEAGPSTASAISLALATA